MSGGPAFPLQEFVVGFDEKPPVMAGKSHAGMTLRDYFAAKAMQGLLAAGHPRQGDNAGDLPVLAYRYADRMIAERNK